MEENKSSKVITIVIVILSILLIGISGYIVYDKVFSQNKTDNEYQYKIIYNDNGIPGNTYYIYLKNNYVVDVEKYPGCSTLECMEGTYIPETEKYTVNVKGNNKVKFDELVKIISSNRNKTENVNAGKIDVIEKNGTKKTINLDDADLKIILLLIYSNNN